jgi:dTDP-4-amino-4,6-dideoxygalactose transaminase
MAVHVSGVPCDVEGLQRRCTDIGAELIFDAAHGSGSLVQLDGKLRPLGGFGRAEVFSLTPTKVMSGAEGGLVTTRDAALAERLRLARDYGNPGDYDTRFVGLNGRLSEVNAALALESLEHLEDRVKHRNVLAERYREAMGAAPGVGFQQVRDGDRSSYKDFTILVDESEFGASREAVVAALHAEGIPSRPYYSPPLHRQQAYAHLPKVDLPVTDRLASQVISLPIWSHMDLETCQQIADALVLIQRHVRDLPATPSSGKLDRKLLADSSRHVASDRLDC